MPHATTQQPRQDASGDSTVHCALHATFFQLLPTQTENDKKKKNPLLSTYDKKSPQTESMSEESSSRSTNGQKSGLLYTCIQIVVAAAPIENLAIFALVGNL